MDLGLSGVKLMISDGGKGIKNAVLRPFLVISWQMSAANKPRVHALPMREQARACQSGPPAKLMSS